MAIAKPSSARRRTLKLTAAAPLIPLMMWKQSSAGIDFEKVAKDNLVARSLNYVSDASQVDKKKFPKFKGNQVCANCHFYSGIDECKWGGCSIIGKLVTVNGWCSAWYIKT